jgi:hypothetical protein
MKLQNIINDLHEQKAKEQYSLNEENQNISKLDFLLIEGVLERFETSTVNLLTLNDLIKIISLDTNMDKQTFLSNLNEMLITSTAFQTPSKTLFKRAKLIAELLTRYSSNRF